MVPGDCRFIPYEPKSSDPPTAKTNGRLFVLKFSSSSQRHIFWMQSKPQGRTGDPTWFSPRDLKLGQIVDRLMQGDDVDIDRELAEIRRGNSGGGGRDDDGDGDEMMGDDEGGDRSNQGAGGSGGAGADATGGDIRDEGEEAREGGADGARA